MLMKTSYKTAHDLGLNDDQYEGLCQTLDLLRHVGYKRRHIDNIDTKYVYELKGQSFDFSMICWDVTPYGRCNTAHCLGGTAEHLMKKSLWPELGENSSQALYQLFYPHNVEGAFDATPKQAADALEIYLMTGCDGYEAWEVALQG